MRIQVSVSSITKIASNAAPVTLHRLNMFSGSTRMVEKAFTINWDNPALTRTLTMAFCLLLLFSVSGTIEAQEPHSKEVEKVMGLYSDGRLDDAELKALRLLNSADLTDHGERASLYRVLAYISIARDERDRGFDFFLEALRENPELRLDRTFTSPKILSVFNRALEEYERLGNEESQDDLSHIYEHNLRLDAVRKSLFLPGAGQFHKGQRTRGWVYVGGAALSGVGFLASQGLVIRYSDRYRSAILPEIAEQRYEDYQTVWRARNLFGIALASFWTASVLDALFTESAPDVIPSLSWSVTQPPSGSGFSLSVCFNFNYFCSHPHLP